MPAVRRGEGLSLAGLLNGSCTVRRDQADPTEAGDYTTEGRLDEDFQDVATGVACRVSQLRASERIADDEGVVATHKVFMDSDADVQRRDRLTSVVADDDASAYSGVVFDVLFVNARPGGMLHHQEVMVKEVRR